MKVGYVRVSSKDQNEARQVEALKSHGVEKFYIDKASGKDTNRAELRKLIEFIREGDTLYIESISRLARNTLDFLTLVKDFTAKNIGIVCLKEALDTTTPQGKFMLTVFGALYELERENIKQRQREGIEIALESGIKFGRPKQEITKEFNSVYKDWKEGNITAVNAMKQVGMKPNTFYRRVKEYEQNIVK